MEFEERKIAFFADLKKKRKYVWKDKSLQVVVVGGGAVGTSTAYHLAARGAGGGVLLLEVKSVLGHFLGYYFGTFGGVLQNASLQANSLFIPCRET